eukprot:COSAG06_NODE_421_length_15973_cov_18.743795_4_plen_669_part_00
MAPPDGVVRVLYRSLLRAAVRIERHWPGPSAGLDRRARAAGRGYAAAEAATIAARAQGFRAQAHAARTLERTAPTELLRHAFRGTVPKGVDLGRLPEPPAAGTAPPLAPAFEALRLATALATDLELGTALRELGAEADEEEGGDRLSTIDQIERGMWLISARHNVAAGAASSASSASKANQQLDAMVAAAQREHSRLAAQCTDRDCPFLWADALNRAVFSVCGFHGNASDYYHPSNSILEDVLQQRTGLPIALGIVYLIVAQRLGLDTLVHPTNFPFHFLLRLDHRSGTAGAESDDGAGSGDLQQCSCVEGSSSSRGSSGGGSGSGSGSGTTADEWGDAAGLWVAVDPETGPEVFRLEWARPPSTPPPPEEVEAEEDGEGGDTVGVPQQQSYHPRTRWLIGRRVTHGRMDAAGGLTPPPAAAAMGGSSSGGSGTDGDALPPLPPPLPPRVRWFKVAMPLTRGAGAASLPGSMVLSASLPETSEGTDEEEGESEARLSCRVEISPPEEQAEGSVGRGEAVAPGIGRRRLEVQITTWNDPTQPPQQPPPQQRQQQQQQQEEGSSPPQPPAVLALQLHQVSDCDQFFIDPFCSGQLLPDWYLLQQTLASASSPERSDLVPLLAPALPSTVLSRVLRNLALAYSRRPGGGDQARAWSQLADVLAATAGPGGK